MIYSKEKINELEEYASVLQHEPLAKYTTFRTGGPADLLIIPHAKKNIPAILEVAYSEELPVTVIGGGSNLLVGDKGIRGLTLLICQKDSHSGNIEIIDNNVFCDASVKKQDFIDFAIQNERGNVSFMAGIPGCIGGGIFMNAGTNLGCFIDILESVEYYDDSFTLCTVKVTREMSSYRKLDLPENIVITGGYFQLPYADPGDTRKEIESIIDDRNHKHPVQYPSAGSVFKNPEGHSSWKLINDAGLKGRMIGDAQVSELHTNFIINSGNAQSNDIRNLVELVRDNVYKQFGILLETEIKMIGEF